MAIDGDFDDCQAIVKSMFADAPSPPRSDLSGVNSINWARIAAQSVYYFTAAVALGAPDRAVDFVVPTGNFGDAFAGYVARHMGLPIDAHHRRHQRQRYPRPRHRRPAAIAARPVIATQCPAMDIQVASNFERLYFEGVGRDAAEHRRAFAPSRSPGAIDIPTRALAPRCARCSAARRSTRPRPPRHARDARRDRRAGRSRTPPWPCAAAAGDRGRARTPLVVLSTAHPAKFPEAVERRHRRGAALPPAVAALAAGPSVSTACPPTRAR